MLSLLLTSLALGQTTGGDVPAINAQLFRPSIDATKTLWTNDTYKASSGYLSGRFAMHYAKDPAIWVREDGEVTKLVSDIISSSFLGAYTAGPVRMGLDVPVYWRSIGSETGGETGLGDMLIDVRGTLLDRTEAPVGIALAARGELPTSTVDAPLGHAGFSWELEGIIDRDFTDRLLVSLNLGTKGVPEAELENFVWNDQLFVRAGAGYGEIDGVGVSVDLVTHTNYAAFGNPYANPTEGLLGGWVTLADSFKLRGAAGSGITPGMGAPQLRVVTMVTYEPPREADTDGDSFADSVDSCPLQPEDFDEVADLDGCPEPTVVTVNIIDSSGTPIPTGTWTMGISEGAISDPAMVYGGEYEVAATAPGYVRVAAIEVIPDAEVHSLTYTLELVLGQLLVTVLSPDGQPLPDAVWQAKSTSGEPSEVHSAGESVPNPPGTLSVRALAPGYRVEQREAVIIADQITELIIHVVPAMAEIVGDKIDIKESVYFKTASAIIKPESFPLLDEVATIVLDHPELTKIRIEGHTDSRGSASYNKKLSDERAASVRQYLIDKGVEGSRLSRVGYGEEKPIDKANNAKAWEMNRRVDFFVEERSD